MLLYFSTQYIKADSLPQQYKVKDQLSSKQGS